MTECRTCDQESRSDSPFCVRHGCDAFDGWGDWTCALPRGHKGVHREDNGAFWYPPGQTPNMDHIYGSMSIWSEPKEEVGAVEVWGDKGGEPEHLLTLSLAAAEDLADQLKRHAECGREAARQ